MTDEILCRAIDTAANQGSLSIIKMDNTSPNIGRTPAKVLLEQLRKLGFDVVDKRP